METLRKRLEEQQERHQGGNKWIGTAGTSPFGAYGYNPEGVRIGQDGSRNRSAVKVWDKREFANLDDGVELGTRNMKLALRKLRKFARRGAPTELRSARDHRRDGALGRLARHQDGAGAAQRGEGAAAARHRRLDGRSRAHLRGAVLGGAQRVQASRALLFPQLSLRGLVARQSAALSRAYRHARGDAHLRLGLQAHLRRRCDHEPVRDRASGRQRRALERGAGTRLARAPDARLSEVRLDQSAAARRTGATVRRWKSSRTRSKDACTR